VLWEGLAQDPVFPALERSGGKMVGVLVAQGGQGERVVLRSFSGELEGRAVWPGWVGPVMDRSRTAALEEETLRRLAGIQAKVEAIDVAGAREGLAEVEARVALEGQVRRAKARADKEGRDRDRAGGEDPAQVERRAQRAKRLAKEAGAAERARVEEAGRVLREREEAVRVLKGERRRLSAGLMAAMFDGVTLCSARGEQVPLRSLFGGRGVRTGAGDCAGPKLLHAANLARLRPLALVEAWWGPTLNDRRHGELQWPCAERCVPVLGHLLCGLEEP
jgi:tRNA pseudouridine32 synthase/23S rRNA pseudouridine746 synthase